VGRAGCCSGAVEKLSGVPLKCGARCWGSGDGAACEGRSAPACARRCVLRSCVCVCVWVGGLARAVWSGEVCVGGAIEGASQPQGACGA